MLETNAGATVHTPYKGFEVSGKLKSECFQKS